MDAIAAEFARPTHLPLQIIGFRLLLATLLGAIVGFEREWRQRPAGLRTHTLICVAAAAFAIIGIEITHDDQFIEDSARFDPIRLIEAVTAGVAFLAAGSIIMARGKVRGLTTGAGMWLAGAVGLAAGLGYWHIATGAALLAVFVLGLMHRFEDSVLDDARKQDGDETP